MKRCKVCGHESGPTGPRHYKGCRYWIDSEENQNCFVRVGVESGGCSGLSYKLEFESIKEKDDQLIEDNGIKLIVNKKSVLYLAGTTLDFSDGLNGKGFVFNNPNANRTCGCGESFSL